MVSNGKEGTIVWSDSGMNKDTREVTFNSSLFKPDTDYTAYIAPIYKYDQQTLQVPFQIPILAYDPPGPNNFKVNYTSRLTAISVSWDATVVSDPNVKCLEVFSEPNDGSCSTQPNGVCVVDVMPGVPGSIIIEDLSTGGSYTVLMRTVNKYGTRSLDGVSSEFSPFFLMSQVTVLSHSFTSDPGTPGTVHTDIEVVGASTFTILFQDTDSGVELQQQSLPSHLASRSLASQDATPGAVYDLIQIRYSQSTGYFMTAALERIEDEVVAVHPDDLEEVVHYSVDTTSFRFYWDIIDSRDERYQVYRRHTVNVILKPATIVCGEESNPCSVPYMDGFITVNDAVDSESYEAEIYVTSDRSSLRSPGISATYFNKKFTITGLISYSADVICDGDKVQLELTVEVGTEFNSITLWSDEPNALNGNPISDPFAIVPASDSMIVEILVNGSLDYRLLILHARLNNSNYDVYGTFQRFQIPIDRQEKTDEIVADVICDGDKVQLELTVEVGTEFNSITLWSDEPNALNGNPISDPFAVVPANDSIIVEVLVNGSLDYRMLILHARLNNSNYDVYGTFQRFQIPIDRQEKTDEIVFCASTRNSSDAELKTANMNVKYNNKEMAKLCFASIDSTKRGLRECFILTCDPPICPLINQDFTLVQLSLLTYTINTVVQ
ncbi:uncharacterized protein LOC142351743 [Convolutriloba macropyga]|uniref:uncharacterized protein LOC142351743 n=1 Tax=Convolutriloba macropyga TaxID=536237 RepID=UPI003F51D664